MGSYFNYPKDFSAAVPQLEIAEPPLVTIVVPVYNTPKTELSRCIASITGQTYKNIEIIVVDDGSEPSCAAHINSLASEDSRIRVINGNHKGVSSARNLGIQAAKGEWLAFSDADDEYEFQFIEEALNIALSADCDLVCGSVFPLYTGNDKPSSSDSFVCYIVDSGEREGETRALALQMLGHVKYKYFTGPDFRGRGPVAKLYKASLIKDLKFDTDISIGEDTLFNYRYIECCARVAIAQQYWYWYYQYAKSAVHSISLEPWITSIDAILANRESDEDPVPFISRCAFMSSQGLEYFISAKGFLKGKRASLSLLQHAGKCGCFNSQTLSGFEVSIWLKIYLWFCVKGWYVCAYYFWALRSRVMYRVRNRELIS